MEGDRNYWDDWMRRRLSRRSMLGRAGLAGLAVAGGSALWGCGTTQTPKAAEPTPKTAESTPKPAPPTSTPVKEIGPKRGGTLKVGGNNTLNFGFLDPHTYFNGYDDTFLRAMFDNMITYDDTLTMNPSISLSESWNVVDDVTLQFKLRKGIKFTDGTDFNAQVVKFNLDRVGKPDTKSPRAYVAQMIKNTEFPDDYTVKVTLKEPAASFFAEMAHAGFGMESPANVAKWDPKELGNHPVGTGPFILTESATDDHYVLSRNKDHWQKDKSGGQLPYLDAVRLMVIPNDTVRLANLRTGNIDVALRIALKDAEAVKADPNLKVIITEAGITGMFWNLSRAPMSNLNFRRACTYAINRESIAKVVSFGTGKPYNGLIIPSIGWAYDSSRPVPPYDPVKAKQYLDQAVAQGVKPEFTTRVSGGDFQRTAEMVQADLAKIGVKLNIVVEDSSTSSLRYWTKFEIESRFGGYGISIDPYSKIYMAHHSMGQYNPERRELGKTWDTAEGYYGKIDPIIESSNRTYDPKKRAKLFYDASHVLDDNVGYLMVYYFSYAMAINKNVDGVSSGGDGYGRFERASFK